MSQDISSFLSELTEPTRQNYTELMQIGHLTHEFEWGGHQFILRTLKIEEEVAIGQIVKNLNGSFTQDKAAIAAIIAASLVSVNGKPLIAELSTDPIVNFKNRYNYIIKNFHWPVIQALNEEYLKMVEKQYEVIEAIANLSITDRMNRYENLMTNSDPLSEQDSSLDSLE